ncbi:unnamed protein product, partial [Choristocarpus tenellus]
THEWQSLLRSRDGGGFVLYAPGRCLAHFAPRYLAGINTPGCQAMILADRADNDLSRRRQSKLDTIKTVEELALEGPREVAALFSLSG